MAVKVRVSEGMVNYLDDDSGHYRPTAKHTFGAFKRLADQALLDPTSGKKVGEIVLVDKSGSKGDNYIEV